MKLFNGLIIMLLLVGSTHGARIADVTRLSNQRTNVITGWGLVFGLKGTGDGGKFLPAMRPLAKMLERYGNTASAIELGDAKNVAIVTLTATIPATGARDGDKLDVYVSSITSSSLRGGRLFVTPMQFGYGDKSIVCGFTQGPITLEDPATPNVGLIKNGCVVEGDYHNGKVDANGMFRLIIDQPSATWTMSSSIAQMINGAEDGQTWAWAISEKEVAVRIPPAEQLHPDSYISRIQRLPLPVVNAEARVVINERTATIVITGDVEISPVVISHKGLTISTVFPQPTPSSRTPVVQTKDFIPLDTNNAGGAKLQDLIAALDQLKVPVQDRIDIIKELHETGKLHAKLLVE